MSSYIKLGWLLKSIPSLLPLIVLRITQHQCDTENKAILTSDCHGMESTAVKNSGRENTCTEDYCKELYI